MKNAHVQLFDQMLAVFNEEDIIELCFRLDIVYADLNGKNRRAKTISLIETCQYADRMAELVKLCQEQRPTAVWPTVPELQIDPPESAAAFEQALDEAAQPDKPTPTPSAKPQIRIPVWVWGAAALLLLALVGLAVWQSWVSESETPVVTVITNPTDHIIGLNEAVKGKIIGAGVETWTYSGSRAEVDIRIESGPNDDFVLILTYQDGGQAAYVDFSGRGEGELLKYYDLQENMRIVVDEAENDGGEYTLSVIPSDWKYLWPGETFGGEIRGANPEGFLYGGEPIRVDVILEMTNAEQPWMAVYKPDGALLTSVDQVDENGRLTLINLELGDQYKIIIRDAANNGAVYRIEMKESVGGG
ncbi:MAG: hypothetical protein R6X34_19130 [Chloroflexota bacterium]